MEAAECRDLLAQAYDHNLVQFGENVRRRVNFICNCCSCCCEALLAIKRFGVAQTICSNFISAIETEKCVGCGKCIKACPMGLQPLQLYRYVNAGMKDELERFNLEDCMECGCCAYVCPGRLPLVETFKAGKKLLKEGKRK